MCFRSPLTALRKALLLFPQRLCAVADSSSWLVRHAVVMRHSVLQGRHTSSVRHTTDLQGHHRRFYVVVLGRGELPRGGWGHAPQLQG